MAKREIVLYPDPVLAKRAAEVPVVDDAIKQLVDDMAETMYAAPGIGLAANQIGVLSRVVVMDVSPPEEERELRVFINPVITAREGKITWEEGCLSIPGVYEKVERSGKLTVEALDRDGNPFTLEADGLLAVCIQHEIDHIDGVVFFDRISMLKRRMALKRYKRVLERRARGEEDDGDVREETAQT
jgi:peptide deformylase